MKFTAAIVAALATAVAAIPNQVFERHDHPGCGDNCARAVIATRFGQSGIDIRHSDCAAYLATTVIPSPTTSTITVSRATIPAYASPCSGEARYLTACSCASVTGETVYGPTPTVYEITTV